MPVRSPIKWVGGKYKIRSSILATLPPSETYTCYVEVFGGAGWVLFGKEPSLVEVLNDIDGELINFYHVLRKDVDRLAMEILNYPLVSHGEFDALVALNPAKLSKLKRAYRFFYVLMAGWGGELDNPRFQTSIKDHGKGNRLFGAVHTLRQRLYPASERLAKVTIENRDWRDCIERYDDPRTVMFLDPPYPGNPCNYSFNMLEIAEHQELARRLGRTKCKWVLTSYDREDVRQMFAGYHIKPVKFASGMDGDRGRQNHEIIVSNYDPTCIHKEYSEVVARSGIRHLAVEDQISIVSGSHKGQLGRVVEFQDGKIKIQLESKKNLTIEPDCIRQVKQNEVTLAMQKQKKTAAIRREIVAGLSSKTILQLSKLQSEGYITDIGASVNYLLRENLASLKDAPNSAK
jgi:DNA adenine methylase